MESLKLILWMVFSLAILIGSLVWKYQIANYEFRHRGGGGLITFRSLPHSWLHYFLKLVSWLTLLQGILMTITSAIRIF